MQLLFLNDEELPVADNVYVDIIRKNSFTKAEKDYGSGVKYPADFISDGFRSQLEESCVSSHTETLRYKETVCL